MPFPPLNDEGDLPPGVYPGTLIEVLRYFGQGSTQRLTVSDRLIRIHQFASATGHLVRFVVFGSYVTAKDKPEDVDIIMIMDDAFDLSAVTGEAALIFDHMQADAHFGANVFWTRRSSALGGEQAMVEHWQVRREGG